MIMPEDMKIEDAVIIRESRDTNLFLLLGLLALGLLLFVSI